MTGQEELMTRRDRIAGIALAVAVMAGLVWASNAPMATNRDPEARLRLAWSARPERIEKCRQQSEEELARLPAHMRLPVACEGATAEYRLQVRIDGELVADRLVHGGGLRRTPALRTERSCCPLPRRQWTSRTIAWIPANLAWPQGSANAKKRSEKKRSLPRSAKKFQRTCRSRDAFTSRRAKCCS